MKHSSDLFNQTSTYKDKPIITISKTVSCVVKSRCSFQIIATCTRTVEYIGF